MVSSGATRPARAPASMDMLHTVMRPSIERASMTAPRYSMTEPMPPPVPIRPMIDRITSLGPEPAGSSPSTVTAMVRGRACGSVWVASTCSTSLVPMPNASAPKAPWVEVWLSPQTTVLPGSVSPSSGPMTCTMPWRSWPMGYSGTPKVAQLARSDSSWRRDTASATGPLMFVVGTLWSSVATVRSGRRTVRPGHAQPVEGLRGGDLVHQVQVDEEDVGAVVAAVDDVGVPDFLAERARGLAERARGLAERAGGRCHQWRSSAAPTATTVTSTAPAGAS